MVRVTVNGVQVLRNPFANFTTYKDFRFWFIRNVLLREVSDLIDYVFIVGVDTMEQGPMGIRLMVPVPSGSTTYTVLVKDPDAAEDKVFDVVVEQSK